MTVVEAILAVFSGVADWFIEAIQSVIPLFWTAAETGDGGSLTFVGVLSVASLAVAMALLLVRQIREMIAFRN